MKIAYLIDWDIQKSSGVLNKISDQISIWEDLGHQVILCIVSYKTNSDYFPQSVKNIKVFERKELHLLFFSSVKTFLGRNAALKRVVSFLKSEAVDMVYYRQSKMWYPYLQKLSSLFPIVMEVNTLDVNEKKHSKKIISKWVYLVGQHFLNKKVKGIVTVTNEIGLWYQKYNKPIAVVPNGTKIPSIFPEIKRGKDSRPALIFIGTPNQKWHGTEKIYYLAQKLPEFDFHIVGTEKLYPTEPPVNIFEYGYINERSILENIYQKVDIGIGSLSLYENGMVEGSPLKVREYIAHGLPVILGYIDPDIDGQPFVLNIGNYQDNIKDHIEDIRKFVYAQYRNRISSAVAEEKVGVKTKEEKRLAFFMTILNQ